MSLVDGFRLGQYEIRPEENSVAGPNGDVHLEPKSMDVLLNLARADGRTLSRDQLIEAVWPQKFVSDDALTRCIALIRRALGDTTSRPEILITVRKRGYRLAAPVSTIRGTIAPENSRSPAILVLPFQNLSQDSADLFLADGLTELVTARLATTGGLRVISRTTAMGLRNTNEPVPEIARRIGVDWVVEGSVLTDKMHIQVVMQLISARDDSHVLAETYRRETRELLNLQNEIANRIAGSISRAIGIDIAQAGRPASTISEDDLQPRPRGLFQQSRR